MINCRQIRDARALVRWNRNDLGKRSTVPVSVLHRAASGDDESHITTTQEVAIKDACAKAGVEFTTDPPSIRRQPTSPTSPHET